MKWNQIVQEIVDSGLSESALAEMIGTTQPTINRIKKGVICEPKYDAGKHLLEIHKQRFSKAV